MRRPAFCLTACLLAIGCSAPPAARAPTGAEDAAAAQIAGTSLDNIITLSDHVISGSAPHSPGDFAALAGAGVTTLVSVDGAVPDAESASEHGIRTVHIPIGYDTVPNGACVQIARVIDAAEQSGGTVYVHCHHGKHRGPAAAASALVALGRLTPEAGLAWLDHAGTSPSYPGLFDATERAAHIDRAAIDAVDVEALPRAAPVTGFMTAMAEIDRAWDHLGAIRAAGWTTPADHPDLVPPIEAAVIERHLRTLGSPATTDAESRDLLDRLLAAADTAAALERALLQPAGRIDTAAAHSAYAQLAASCDACHADYRNSR